MKSIQFQSGTLRGWRQALSITAALVAALAHFGSVSAAETNLSRGTNDPPRATGDAPQAITWAAIKSKVADGKILLLDVRPKGIYDFGHIPGALCFPLTTPPQQFAELRSKYPTNTTVVTYCSGGHCTASIAMAHRLRSEFGYSAVYYMPGGYPEWLQAEGKNR